MNLRYARDVAMGLQIGEYLMNYKIERCYSIRLRALEWLTSFSESRT